MSQISKYSKFGNENNEDPMKVKRFIYLPYLLARKYRCGVLLLLPVDGESTY